MTTRLSKFQKWVLTRICDKTAISKTIFKEFYGKKSGGWFSRGEPCTNSERVKIHRSVKNMVHKGLIHVGKHGSFYLTEQGFRAWLNANETVTRCTNVSFKDYEDRRDASLAEYETFLGSFKKKVTV